jgi:hypothetical protein
MLLVLNELQQIKTKNKHNITDSLKLLSTDFFSSCVVAEIPVLSHWKLRIDSVRGSRRKLSSLAVWRIVVLLLLLAVVAGMAWWKRRRPSIHARRGQERLRDLRIVVSVIIAGIKIGNINEIFFTKTQNAEWLIFFCNNT